MTWDELKLEFEIWRKETWEGRDQITLWEAYLAGFEKGAKLEKQGDQNND
jgi:hypothetical protein